MSDPFDIAGLSGEERVLLLLSAFREDPSWGDNPQFLAQLFSDIGEASVFKRIGRDHDRGYFSDIFGGQYTGTLERLGLITSVYGDEVYDLPQGGYSAQGRYDGHKLTDLGEKVWEACKKNA